MNVLRITAFGIFVACAVYITAEARADERPRQQVVPPISAYGYYPFEKGYGPIYAARELDPLTFSPRKPGLDYGYGIGYFFGIGPRFHYTDRTIRRNPWR